MQPGVTPGAILELHAARADGGLRPGRNGRLQWTDLSGNGNHGTLSGFAWTEASGWSADRLTFDGVDDYVALPALHASESAEGFTFESWVDVPAIIVASEDWATLIDESSAVATAPAIRTHLNRTGGYARFSVHNGIAWRIAAGAADLRGGTHHIVGALGTDQIARLYVDGSLVATITVTGGSLATGYSTVGASRYFGYATNGYHFNNVSHRAARIYPFALTPEQVAAQYAAGPASNTVDGAVLDLRAALATGDGPNDNAVAGTTEWHDTSGNGNHLTLVNFDYTPTNGWIGGSAPGDHPALLFDGTMDSAIAAGPLHVMDAKVGTYEAWIKLDAPPAATQTIFREWGPTLNEAASLTINSGTGQARFVLRTQSEQINCGSVGPSVCDGAWHHLLGTADGTSMRFYIDGALLAGPQPVATGIADYSRAFTVGYVNGGNYVGPVAVVRVYPFALTPEQVAANYAAGLRWLSRRPSGLLVYQSGRSTAAWQ